MLVESIDDIDRLRAIQPAWNDLWSRVSGASPFQHSSWLLPWWDSFGSGQVFSFALWEGDRLAALAPMFLHRWEGRRQVTFLGNGVSDRLDFMAERPLEHARTILEAIGGQRERWDICDLQDLPAGSALARAEVSAGLQAEIRPQYPCGSIPLPSNWDEYSAGLPHGLKRNLRRYRTQLDASGEASLESAVEENFEEHLKSLFCLHRARWAMKDDKGMLDGSVMARFHSVAARKLWATGLVRMHGLRLQGALIAVVYAFVHAKRAYSYLGGFSPEAAKFSPGALILEYTIREALLEGVAEFDFLRGEESYKADWGARKSYSSRLLLTH